MNATQQLNTKSVPVSPQDKQRIMRGLAQYAICRLTLVIIILLVMSVIVGALLQGERFSAAEWVCFALAIVACGTVVWIAVLKIVEIVTDWRATSLVSVTGVYVGTAHMRTTVYDVIQVDGEEKRYNRLMTNFGVWNTMEELHLSKNDRVELLLLPSHQSVSIKRIAEAL